RRLSRERGHVPLSTKTQTAALLEFCFEPLSSVDYTLRRRLLNPGAYFEAKWK
ncbi:hypothetical protein LINPERPRIM_LOCUS41027, partial [Linum perenne]